MSDVADHEFLNTLLVDDNAFDLADVPADLVADDPVDQAEAMMVMLHHSIPDIGGGILYDAVPVTKVKLSRFRDHFQAQKADHAIAMLGNRVKLQIDDDLQMKPDDTNLTWTVPGHFLDYKLVSSNCIGLAATLPRTIPVPTYEIRIAPEPGREFRARYGYLAWPTAASMFYLGQSPHGELWLGMRPTSGADLEGNDEYLLSDMKDSTRLKGNHWKMVYMFMSHCLSIIGNTSIVVTHKYGPSNSKDMNWNIHEYSNLRSLTETHPYTLSFQQARELDHIMVRTWPQFVQRAPPHWKADGWLENCSPHSVVHRYGQNQQIVTGESDAEQEATNWDNEHDYSRIGHLTIALATHVEAYVVSRYIPLPHDVVMGDNTVLYDSPDPETRNPIDLAVYPLLDEDGREQRVFTEHGQYRPRQDAECATNQPCGLLVDIPKITEAFDTRPSGMGFHGRSPKSRVTGYPQAFLQRYGHLQARGGIPFLTGVVDTVNREMGMDVDQMDIDNDNMDDEWDNNQLSNPRNQHPLVEAIQTQLYNELSHRTRTTSKMHAIQGGKTTSACAGSYATDTSGKAKARKQWEYCNQRLPHRRFAAAIKRSNLPNVRRALRIEVNWTIRVGQLQQEDRNGRTIYQKVVTPLCNGWRNMQAMERLKSMLLVLRPEVFPKIYQWMTYAICYILEKTWAKYGPLIAAGNKPPPDLVELVAVLERTLAYAHTGNAKVLSRGLMRPMWLVQSLFEHGPPIFAPSIRININDARPIFLPLSVWPHTGGVPESAAQRAITLTFGDTLYKTFRAYLQIATTLARRSNGEQHGIDRSEHLSTLMAEVALSTLLEEYKDLIRAGVKANANQLRQSGQPSDGVLADTSEDNLKRWSKEAFPFSFCDDAFDFLVRAVVTDRLLLHQGLPNKEKMTIQAWITLLVDMTIPDTVNTTISAPLTKNGPATNVCRAAIEQILPLGAGRGNNMTPRKFVIAAFVRAADRLKINFVPWKPPPTQVRGSLPSNPKYTHWLSLGERDRNTQAQAATEDPVAIAKINGQNDDTRASWSACSETIKQLGRCLDKTVPPDEWVFENSSITKNTKDSLIVDTYRYLWGIFDIQKPLHHLALLTAILFSKMAPTIDVDKTTKPTQSTSEESLTMTVRHLKWYQKLDKGRTNRPRIIVITTLYILAFYEPDSPVRKLLKKGEGIGTDWSGKHSSKALSPLQLVRLGLARAKGLRIFNAAIYGHDWSILSDTEISTRYKNLLRRWRDGQYGPFHAAAMVVGYPQAWQLAEVSGEFPADPTYQLVSEKRVHDGDQRDDDIPTTSRNKQKRT